MKSIGRLSLAVALASTVLLSAPSLRTASAGMMDMVKDAGGNLAAPLGEKFGVPTDAVSGLFKSGLSTEGVVQALLISKTSGTPIDKVSSLLGSKKNDVGAVGKELGVDPSVYGKDKVSGVISEVSGAAGKPKAEAEKAASDVKGKADATAAGAKGQAQGAADSATGAIGGILGK